MGLNFNFNYLKNLSQVNFNANAPTHRECSDGLNMFVYCQNSQCVLYNEMYVRNLGYGCFDIIRETLRTKCPQCRSSSFSELRNIGMINSTWIYNGVINSTRESCFEGDGTTIINNRLYLLSEVKICNVFSKLLIKIKPHKSKTDLNEKNTNFNKGDYNEDASSLFDSIPLVLDKKYNIHHNDTDNNHNEDESVVINHLENQKNQKRIDCDANIINRRIIKTDLDDKGAYCLNGCLLQNGSSTSLNAKCTIF